LKIYLKFTIGEVMKAGYVLSGEHKELPYGELKALFEIFNCKNKIKKFDRYVVADGDEELIRKIVKRGGYINEGHSCHFEYDIEEFKEDEIGNFVKEFENFANNNELPIHEKDTFAVRVLKIYKTDAINSMDIERKIGHIIKTKTNAKVNLSKPDKLIRIVVLNEKIFLGILVEQRDREYFQKNRPHLRKYFHPGCILPKLARAMVNLARIKENDIVLDPFCGTGGFLIEAGLIGCRLIGSDIDWRMASGTKINLESYNLTDKIIAVEKWDAKDVKKFLEKLGIDEVDAIVTDPPYGISTSKKGDVENYLKEFKDILKDGGYLVFAAPRKIDIDMDLREIYDVYVHSQLTRYIHVYRKIS